MWKVSPHHNRYAPKSIPLDNASLGEVFPMMSVNAVLAPGQKRVKWDLSVKRAHLHCLIGNLLEACAITACAINHSIWHMWCAEVRSGPTYVQLARIPASCSQFPTVPWWIGQLCMPKVVRAVLAAVRWKLCKCRRRIALSWRHGEIFSSVILSLPLIQEGRKRLSVSTIISFWWKNVHNTG